MKHLLFIPAPEHRDALLGEGVGGSRPPVASWRAPEVEEHRVCLDCDMRYHDEDDPPHCAECHEFWPCGQPNREVQPGRWETCAGWEWGREGAGRPPYPPDGALVLVWNGAFAAEGYDRLARLVGNARVPPATSLRHAGFLANNCAKASLGTVVVVED